MSEGQTNSSFINVNKLHYCQILITLPPTNILGMCTKYINYIYDIMETRTDYPWESSILDRQLGTGGYARHQNEDLIAKGSHNICLF